MITGSAFVEILKCGPGTTVRDKGRLGFALYGVPMSGPADSLAFEWVNHLLKNDPNSAVIEISQPGLSLRFQQPTQIALAGAKAKININNHTVASFGLHQIQRDDILEIGAFSAGSLLYLGIHGGIQTEVVLGSRSFYPGITPLSFFKKGDQIPVKPLMIENKKTTFSNVKWDVNRYASESIEVYPGPEWHLLTEWEKEQLIGKPLTVSSMKNAMAIQLEELLPNQLPEISTAPVYPGTVQLTSGGKLLCLMQDAQVTGGYPRVLQVTENSLGNLAQKKPGAIVKFELMC
ncbi:biotin-dependent carboxyltransferase family protein [Algoriphagus sp. CAU 1675]|uniref:5-oxoprolinase subunit C family protein n=1 Tax=Algoriphagus sp. CAU 1675 TaxID=3032597 RepID=UPI0023DA31A3|nr:biotin-dependent carboxyltransferase family protein [Algoriphagus sp. CAU 1675]MDF2157632.1 biotin-dependent carboxyltransferase family protein [Algoriphagus sp. CAU 1675]